MASEKQLAAGQDDLLMNIAHNLSIKKQIMSLEIQTKNNKKKIKVSDLIAKFLKDKRNKHVLELLVLLIHIFLIQ